MRRVRPRGRTAPARALVLLSVASGLSMTALSASSLAQTPRAAPHPVALLHVQEPEERDTRDPIGRLIEERSAPRSAASAQDTTTAPVSGAQADEQAATAAPVAGGFGPSGGVAEANASADPLRALIDEQGGIQITEVKEAAGTAPTDAARPADLWQRIRNGFAMPNLATPLVVERQNWYASQPQFIKLMTERSRRYMFHIVEELERRGMPTELALLPIVESAFNPMAYSRAHAAGLWQFIPSTGKHYKLQQNWWYDARRDIVASTTAALDYLQTIYEMHGDWHLALASYNWGEWAVARAVERNKKAGLPTDYASLPMPAETRHYVPKLQALKNIIANPAASNVELDPIPNAPYFASVTLTRDIDLHVAAKLADMPVEELVALNPGHNRPVASSAQAPALILPAERLERFMENLGSYDKPLTSWHLYAAQRGETLQSIAARHGMSVEQLQQVNGIRGTGRLPNDTQLLVASSANAQSVPGLFAGVAMVAADPQARTVAHKVAKGESWYSIAKRYGVRVDQLQSWNKGDRLIAGQTVTVAAPAATAQATRPVTAAGRPVAAKQAPARTQAKSQPIRKPAGKVQVAKR